MLMMLFWQGVLSLNLYYLHAIKDLGAARCFLGMEIAGGDSGVSVCQWKYVLDILERVGLLGCRGATTPFPPLLVSLDISYATQ